MRIEYGALTDVSASDIPEDGRFVVPDGVTIIGFCAFANRTNLTSITIPESVTDIGDFAFDGCSGLHSITIPNSVKSVGTGAFNGCYAITSAIIPSIAILSIPKANLRTVVITSGTRIGDFAFRSCCGLISVTIPDSVTRIGRYAFQNCSELTEITIGKGVTSIGGFAFYGCASLTSITIPDGVTSIEWGAFKGCYKLTSIVIPDSITNIGEDAFYDTPLKSIRRNYKAFRLQPDGELICRTKPYKLGEKASVEDELILCANGIHYCTNLFEIFSYYSGKYGMDFVIAECEVSKEQKRECGSSKRCARWIIPKRILTREEIMKTLSEGRRQKS